MSNEKNKGYKFKVDNANYETEKQLLTGSEILTISILLRI